MTPSWILDIFAAIMLVVAAVSAGRLVVAQPWRQGAQRAALADIDVAHLLMAIAMAGMLTASLQTLPNGAWEVIFGVLTAWFAYRVARDVQVSGVRALAGGHCAPHLIHAAAMLYMFLALAAPAAHGSGMSGMGGAAGTMGTLSLPFLAFIFALLLIGYSIWDLDQLSGPGTSGHYSLAVARVAPASAVLVGRHGGGRAGRCRHVRAGWRPPGRLGRGHRAGHGQPGPARRRRRPGERRRPGHPRPVGGDQFPDRHGRHHGVHAADPDLGTSAGGTMTSVPPVPAPVRRRQLVNVGSPPRTGATRPLGSSQSSWRPSAVRSRKV